MEQFVRHLASSLSDHGYRNEKIPRDGFSSGDAR